MRTPEAVLRDIVDDFRTSHRGSLRILAERCGVAQSTLSRVLRGKLRLSVRQARRIIEQDELAPHLRAELEASYFGGDGSGKKTGTRAERDASPPLFVPLPIADSTWKWIDLAILDYFTIPGASQETRHIARRLGVHEQSIFDAIERLEKAGAIVLREGLYAKNKKRIMLDFGGDLNTVRDIHRGLMNRGLDCLRDGSAEAVDARHCTSYTSVLDPEKLPEARRRIDAFQAELLDFLRPKGRARRDSTVYGWSSLLFPIQTRSN